MLKPIAKYLKCVEKTSQKVFGKTEKVRKSITVVYYYYYYYYFNTEVGYGYETSIGVISRRYNVTVDKKQSTGVNMETYLWRKAAILMWKSLKSLCNE